jgi:hypothetical protein
VEGRLGRKQGWAEREVKLLCLPDNLNQPPGALILEWLQCCKLLDLDGLAIVSFVPFSVNVDCLGRGSPP